MAFKGILDTEIDSALRVNPKFAKSFEERKRREEIQKAKKRAEELEIYSGSDKSSEESEDSSAELLTEKANSKFMKVLTMIKKGDPKLKDPNFQAFSDSDFDRSSESSVHSNKPVRYKELLTKQMLNPDIEEPKDTQIAQEKNIKSQFLSAVEDWAQNNTGDDILVSRKPKKVRKESSSDEELGHLVKSPVGSQEKDELTNLKEYWGHADDNDDLFLKKFVLKKLWEDPEDQLMTYNEIVDEEDAVKTDQIEKFETAYNFRFEEEGFEKLKSNK